MEEILLLLIRSRNKKAFSYYYKLCAGALYEIINRTLKDTVHSEDIVQSVFVKISDDIENYDPLKSSLFPWIIDIAQHEIQSANSSSYINNRSRKLR